MSLSRPKKTPARTAKKKEMEKAHTFRCPECGAQTLRKVRSHYQVFDGTVIRNLERLKCSNCLANLFDRAAMREIRRQRAIALAKKKSGASALGGS
jgi:DNA-directed RNA polymerase subunit RPC12/RpoP